MFRPLRSGGPIFVGLAALLLVPRVVHEVAGMKPDVFRRIVIGAAAQALSRF